MNDIEGIWVLMTLGGSVITFWIGIVKDVFMIFIDVFMMFIVYRVLLLFEKIIKLMDECLSEDKR